MDMNLYMINHHNCMRNRVKVLVLGQVMSR